MKMPTGTIMKLHTIATIVGAALIVLGLAAGIVFITGGHVSQGAKDMLVGVIVGGLINGGLSILTAQFIAGKDVVKIEAPEKYRIEVSATVKENH